MIIPLEFIGRYGKDCKVFTQYVDQPTTQQIYQLLNHPLYDGKIRIMNDCHLGKGGACIGLTMKVPGWDSGNYKIIPSTIGVDIGCGMLSFEIKSPVDMSWDNRINIVKQIKNIIPFDTDVHTSQKFDLYRFIHDCNVELQKLKEHEVIISKEWLIRKCKQIDMNYDRFLSSVGTLGGGNHFLECGRSEDGTIIITIHSGSRQFGQRVCGYHQTVAKQKQCHNKERELNGPIQNELTWLEDESAISYIVDMTVAMVYARYNRMTMMNLISTKFNWNIGKQIETIHNYINMSDGIIRKGAVSANDGEEFILPFNMISGLLLCVGKGNPEWNNSAPHGAGRNQSRTSIKALKLGELTKERMMKLDIYFEGKVPDGEVPEGYKDPDEIKNSIDDTCDVVRVIKPLFNIKGKD